MSLARLVGLGYAVADCEVRRGRVAFDAYGFGDLIAARPGSADRLLAGDILLVQATVADRYADHMRKMWAARDLGLWVRAGGRLEVHSWYPSGQRGGLGKCRRVRVCRPALPAPDLSLIYVGETRTWEPRPEWAYRARPWPSAWRLV